MKIVAVGGGEIGRPGTPIETEKIDKETIKLSGKKHPKLLFIPTASSDSEGYVEVIKRYFGKRLGCRVDILYLLKNKPSRQEIRKKIMGADIVYAGGGNTLKMMIVWRKSGVDKILKEAARKGTIFSGVSAGAVCWFNYANSDSRRFTNPKAPMIRVKGLGLVPALCCPHYNGEWQRKPALKKMMKKTAGVAIALDNCAAMEIVGNTYRIITSKPHVGAYRVFWSKGKSHHEHILSSGEFLPLSELMAKT
ncbi:MAG TPA: peptidase E [Candidatus Taylorbacteria bacterium]|nr:MAG: Peptidase E [Parcubacteria group bacterium GW2011_GWA2_47_64]KKU96730.1 MAG: Peptidase E [Parcubacteria group bacterium GW2011_GWC2_48_17]HBV01087.1 peptidase E [Candidatus Taylorbacteria bacterium]